MHDLIHQIVESHNTWELHYSATVEWKLIMRKYSVIRVCYHEFIMTLLINNNNPLA